MNISQIEHASMASWPALQELPVQGGILRYSSGVSHRANSLTLTGDNFSNPQLLISKAEDFYHSHDRRVIVRICGGHDSLCKSQHIVDSELAEIGYSAASKTHVMVKHFARQPRLTKKNVPLVAETIDVSSWLIEHYRIKNLGASEFVTHLSMLEKLVVPCNFIVIKNVSGEALATGFATLTGSAVGIYGVATHEDHRRQGHAASIVSALEYWGHCQGGQYSYLQVEAANKAAFGLYQKFGYKSFYNYWYRIEQ